MDTMDEKSERYYLESHITISPVMDEKRKVVSDIAAHWGFKLAHLVMLKDKGPDRPSQRDTFMTGHSKNVDDLAERTMDLCKHLQAAGYPVWRYKIESCVIDSRQQGDIWKVLDSARPEQPLIACDNCSR